MMSRQLKWNLVPTGGGCGGLREYVQDCQKSWIWSRNTDEIEHERTFSSLKECQVKWTIDKVAGLFVQDALP